MKALLNLVLLLPIVGCASAEAAVSPGEAAAVHAHVIAMRNHDAVVNPLPSPELRCGGDRVITHGDGHTTPCPGCVDCRKQAEVTSIDEVFSTASIRGACDPATGCLAGDCPTVQRSSRSTRGCSAGGCSAAAGPLRKAVAAQPVRKAVKAIRERRPARRLLGRLFGRGGC